MYDLHGTECHFIHRRVIGAVSGFVGGGPLGAASGFLGGGKGRKIPAGAQFLSQADRHTAHGHIKDPRTGMRSGHSGGASRAGVPVVSAFTPIDEGCIWPTRRDPITQTCRIFLGDQTGPDDQPVGEAVMGQFGAALVPGRMAVSRAVCIRGMVVGSDGLCYNKSAISNKDRMWPRGRQPLLTGGEMRAISIAARAAGKFERTQKRLQKIGMIKKPSRGRRPAPAHPAHPQLGPGS